MFNRKDKYEHPNKLAIAVGARVRQAREEAGLSQAQLAEMVYVQRNSITSIETGKSEPSLSTMLLIATSLEKPFEYFLADAPIPSAWKLNEGSLTVEERLMLLKFKDIREPKDIAILYAFMDTLVRIELKEWNQMMAEIRKRDKGNKKADPFDAETWERFSKLDEEEYIEAIKRDVLDDEEDTKL